jgi:hypothetical protein
MHEMLMIMLWDMNACLTPRGVTNHYDLGWYIGWFEIPRDFVGLPELYGLKCENLITSVIIFVLVLL